jgi:hypothetical protein
MNASVISPAIGLRQALAGFEPDMAPAGKLARLIASGLDQLPLPGSGQTLARWQSLAEVAAHDLSLAKLYEGHTDAQAILAELDPSSYPPATFRMAEAVKPAAWGVWAAEAPGCRVLVEPKGAPADRRVQLRGTKAWCSGAESGSHALLTAWAPDADQPQLVAVDLAQPQIAVSEANWKAVGMRESASLQVTFEGAEGWLVGQPGAYLARPGFWQGGAGIAACWYGGALRIARALRDALAASGRRDPFRLAAAGRVDVALQGTAAQLRRAAQWIDAHPLDDAQAVALRVRLAASAAAADVLARVGDALGPAPFCKDGGFAQAAADLPVFIRQSHADHDYAALGECVANDKDDPWKLQS